MLKRVGVTLWAAEYIVRSYTHIFRKDQDTTESTACGGKGGAGLLRPRVVWGEELFQNSLMVVSFCSTSLTMDLCQTAKE